MLRRMSALDPVRITFLASLAVAGISAGAMDIFDRADASLLILVFNLGSAVVVLASGWLLNDLRHAGA